MAAAAAGPSRSTRRTILELKYPATMKYAATNTRAGFLLVVHATIPTGAAKTVKWKYFQ